MARDPDLLTNLYSNHAATDTGNVNAGIHKTRICRVPASELTVDSK